MKIPRQIGLEEAKKVVNFFAQNPERKQCLVGLGKPRVMYTHSRDDLPKLKAIIKQYEK